MNEHGFIRSIHRRLPAEIYCWKINDNYAGGVADSYYSAIAGDCWVEYKYLAKLPKRDTSKVVIGTSPQQRLWLSARAREGRRVALVVGSPEGCLVLQDAEIELEYISTAEFKKRAVPVQSWVEQLARWTLGHTIER